MNRVVPALLALLLAVGGFGLVAWLLARWERGALRGLELQMLSTGRAVAEFASQSMEADNLPNLQRLARATQNATDSRIRIMNMERQLLVDSLNVPADRQQGLGFRVEVRQAMKGGWSGYTRLSDENPLSLALFVAVPITSGDKVIGVAYVSHSTDVILQRLGELRRKLQAIATGLAVVAFISALYSSRQLRLVLKNLRLRAGQLEGGDDVEAIGQGIDKLVTDLQHQVAQLEEEKLKTRYFLEDVAHELKTPITGLSGSVEALLGEQDTQRQQRLLHNVERETRRLSELVASLVELQNLDYYELSKQKFAANTLLETAADTYEHEAEKKHVKLVLETSDSISAYGDPDKLLTVVCNLLDNAIRCTPAGSSVSLALLPEEKAVRIQVKDEGPGFEHSLIARRSRTGKAGGLGNSGLGLAIAHQIVKLHGGHLQVLSRPEGGSCVEFAIPQE